MTIKNQIAKLLTELEDALQELPVLDPKTLYDLAPEGEDLDGEQLRRDERVFSQASEGLDIALELRELERIPEAWNELATTFAYLGHPLHPEVDNKIRGILGELEALTFRRDLAAAEKLTDEKVSHVSLDLVDPLLLQLIEKKPELLRTLDWRIFERLLAQVLEDLGFEIELQRGTKDGGVDIFALKNSGPFGPHRYLLQAKRWSNAVGVEPVRELLFLHSHYRMTKSCLATTSRFTSGAWNYAKEYRWQLELKDFERLLEWIDLAATSKRTHNKSAAPDVNRALRGRHR